MMSVALFMVLIHPFSYVLGDIISKSMYSNDRPLHTLLNLTIKGCFFEHRLRSCMLIPSTTPPTRVLAHHSNPVKSHHPRPQLVRLLFESLLLLSTSAIIQILLVSTFTSRSHSTQLHVVCTDTTVYVTILLMITVRMLFSQYFIGNSKYILSHYGRARRTDAPSRRRHTQLELFQ